MKEHKHAALLRMAADNADQLFECDETEEQVNVLYVLTNPEFDWRPVKQTKKIKLLAYLVMGQLMWFDVYKCIGRKAVRVPSEDKEIEVIE